MLQLKAKKNDSKINACVWAQHVCENIRIESENLSVFFASSVYSPVIFYEEGIEAKRLNKRNPTSLFTCSFAHGHWFISHKNRKAFVCTLDRYIITDPLENVEPTRRAKKNLLIQWRSVHFDFLFFFCAIFHARERIKAHLYTIASQTRNGIRRFFFACKYSHCIDLYSFNTFSCITKRRRQQRPATMCIHTRVNVNCGWRRRWRWWW